MNVAMLDSPSTPRSRLSQAPSLPQIPALSLIALAFLALVLLLAVFGEALAPYEYGKTDILNTLLPPAFVPGGHVEHLLGTDNLGRDIFSRLLFSIRVTVVIALVGAGMSAVMGTLLGMVAGQLRGPVEEVLMMAVDIQASLPFLVFALTALAIFGNSFGVLLLVIGINGWESYARLARAMVLSIMERDYVLAARALGIGKAGLYWRYLLPNMVGPLTVQFSLTLAGILTTGVERPL